MLFAFGALATAGPGCGSSSSYYYDPYAYAYGYYYPTDMAYADAYYADSYYGYPTTYVPLGPSTYTSGSLSKASLHGSAPGTALRDLAFGKSVCDDRVTVTTERFEPPCSDGGDNGSLPLRTEIVFDACVLRDGGQLDGVIEVEAVHMFSDNDCDNETVVDVTYTSTSTDLSYTAPGGERIVMPSLRRSGSYRRPLTGRPSVLNVSVEGSVERYDAGGEPLAITTLNGTQTLVPTGSGDGYRVDGTLMMQDMLRERTLSVTGVGVTRTDTCCHPTGGTIAVAPSEGEVDDWSFGPNCGDASRNGEPFVLDQCL